jgi:hypothetical protein
VNPLGRGAGRLGRAGRVCGEDDWAALWIRPKCLFLKNKFFSFSNLFYKLQVKFDFQRLLLTQ